MMLHRDSHRLGVTGIVGVLLLLLAGCGGPNPVMTPTPTPTTPVSPLEIVSYDLHIPAELLNAPTIGPLPGTTKLHVGFTFKTNQQLLNQLGKLKVQQGQGQSLETVANQLGINDATYQQIKAFFGIENVTLSLNAVHTTLMVDGQAAVFARLFQTQFVLHQLNGRQVFAPASNPKMPRFLADALVAITGMDNFTQPPHKRSFMPHPFSAGAFGASRKPGANCQPNPSTVPIDTIGRLYGYNDLWQAGFDGAGMTINLLEFDTVDKPDLDNYFACSHFRGKFTTVDVLHTPPHNVIGESLIDVETIASLAPAANIVDFQLDQNTVSTDPFLDVLQEIINAYAKNASSASVLSISWGNAEALFSPQDIMAIDQNLSILTRGEHMTVFVAAGDCAAFDDEKFGDLSVDFPGTDPSAVDVGGTMPGRSTPIYRGWNGKANEVVWADGSNHKKCQNLWGGGGGNSRVFKRPAYQKAMGVDNKYSRGMREVPDVTAFAFPLAAYLKGQWTLGGGTSAAAPEWAAAMSLLNEATIKKFNGTYFYGPSLFYQVEQYAQGQQNVHPYRDVTQGNNLHFPATPGWDFASGLGAPNLPDFYQVLLVLAQQP